MQTVTGKSSVGNEKVPDSVGCLLSLAKIRSVRFLAVDRASAGLLARLGACREGSGSAELRETP